VDYVLRVSVYMELMIMNVPGHAFCGGIALGLLSRYSDPLRAGRSVYRIPVGGEIFRTGPDRP